MQGYSKSSVRDNSDLRLSATRDKRRYVADRAYDKLASRLAGRTCTSLVYRDDVQPGAQRLSVLHN